MRQIVSDRSRGICEAMCAHECARTAEHVHHRLMRSQGGSDEPDNLLHVCHVCHAYIHAHPTEAYERGWLVRGVGRQPSKSIIGFASG